MADVNALYPQPVAPSQGLMSDPAKVVGLMGALNQNKLFQAQYPALAQQPQASLEGQQIHNATSQMEQNEKGAQFTAHYFGSLPDDAKPEDIYKMKAAIRAVHPNISGETINTVADIALRDPKGLRNGIATLRTIGVSPEGIVGRVAGPPTATGAPTQQPVTSAIRGGATPVDISPKEKAAQAQTGSGAGSAINDARLHSLNFNQQVFPLEQAIPALEKLGKTGTGPGTEEFNHVKSFLQSAGIPGLDTEKIKTFDEAKKYLTDFVNQNGNSGTNDKLAAAFAGNPSVNISNAAATDVAKSALTLRRMKQAQLVAFENSGKPEEDFPKEAGKWAREHDPRAYGFDLMTPDARKKVLESLPAGKRELFMMDVQDALKSGIIKAPR